ncbi:hypothetical protein KORDIASMS9_01920 [Kordia sp. SMS9]|uniref:hypothetical protein n=1 Tax=Kordia sp. SMS9 TaxID=2282170 RepID=UPI000E107394|nr:hypothetical protein [Kordia sp. SMS9]AXG69693.1 hypothetical protein KORDIASMS9_01920 [Kordia sp. SMS9]
MFAGPNGSGKSTVYDILKDRFDIGIYVNADDIEKKLNGADNFNLSDYGFKNKITKEYFLAFIENHTLYKKATSRGFIIDLEFKNGEILNPNKKTHSYEASILADFIRNELIEGGEKLTFETVRLSQNPHIIFYLS